MAPTAELPVDSKQRWYVVTCYLPHTPQGCKCTAHWPKTDMTKLKAGVKLFFFYTKQVTQTNCGDSCSVLWYTRLWNGYILGEADCFTQCKSKGHIRRRKVVTLDMTEGQEGAIMNSDQQGSDVAFMPRNLIVELFPTFLAWDLENKSISTYRQLWAALTVSLGGCRCGNHPVFYNNIKINII